MPDEKQCPLLSLTTLISQQVIRGTQPQFGCVETAVNCKREKCAWWSDAAKACIVMTMALPERTA